MQFVLFQEQNDWEGEIWRFWLQLDGNEEALELLEEFTDDDEYTLYRDPVEEWEVDVLVKWTGYGYLPFKNKITGKLEIPAKFESDDLYCGQIKELFKE